MSKGRLPSRLAQYSHGNVVYQISQGCFFGGEGFILQGLQGTTSTTSNGEETVFLKAYGTVVKKELQSGERLRVSSGSLVAMTSTIDYGELYFPTLCVYEEYYFYHRIYVRAKSITR